MKKMVKKTKTSNKKTKTKKIQKKKKLSAKDFPTLKLIDERDIALDFAKKIYKRLDRIVKSVILFGSSVKNTATSTSDIDIIVLLDDATVQFDEKLTAWYRGELGKIIQENPYKKSLHVNTVRITTWWQDLLRGDPVVVNVLRYGEALIDLGGFFNPLKVLLQQGKIRSTPEAIYTTLQRAPTHLARSKASELAAVEGIYWAMVDSAHAALMAAEKSPPSPEHIPIMLKEVFVDKKMLDMDYVVWYRDIHMLHRKIVHGEITDLRGAELDDWQDKADRFIRATAELIKKIV